MATPLTDRQRQVLEHIATSIRRNGIVPSVREIGQALGMRSPSTVHQHLMALERKGYVKRYGDRMRVLEVLDKRILPDGNQVAIIGQPCPEVFARCCALQRQQPGHYAQPAGGHSSNGNDAQAHACPPE